MAATNERMVSVMTTAQTHTLHTNIYDKVTVCVCVYRQPVYDTFSYFLLEIHHTGNKCTPAVMDYFICRILSLALSLKCMESPPSHK